MIFFCFVTIRQCCFSRAGSRFLEHDTAARKKPDPRTQPSDADKSATVPIMVLIYLRILREPESVAWPECMQVWNPIKSLAHVIAMPIG